MSRPLTPREMEVLLEGQPRTAAVPAKRLRATVESHAALLAALEKAQAFIDDDTCRHDSEKVAVTLTIQDAIAAAKGGGT